MYLFYNILSFLIWFTYLKLWNIYFNKIIIFKTWIKNKRMVHEFDNLLMLLLIYFFVNKKLKFIYIINNIIINNNNKKNIYVNWLYNRRIS